MVGAPVSGQSKRSRWRYQARRREAIARLLAIEVMGDDNPAEAWNIADGATFDVHEARELARGLIALEAEQAVFEDWTRERGLGPENREPGSFCAAAWHPAPSGVTITMNPRGGWPGNLAREYAWKRCPNECVRLGRVRVHPGKPGLLGVPIRCGACTDGRVRHGDSRAPMGRSLAKLGRDLLAALEGQPSECQAGGCQDGGRAGSVVGVRRVEVRQGSRHDWSEAPIVVASADWVTVMACPAGPSEFAEFMIEFEPYHPTPRVRVRLIDCGLGGGVQISEEMATQHASGLRWSMVVGPGTIEVQVASPVQPCTACHGTGHNLRGVLPSVEIPAPVRRAAIDEMERRAVADCPTDETWRTIVHEEMSEGPFPERAGLTKSCTGYGFKWLGIVERGLREGREIPAHSVSRRMGILCTRVPHGEHRDDNPRNEQGVWHGVAPMRNFDESDADYRERLKTFIRASALLPRWRRGELRHAEQRAERRARDGVLGAQATMLGLTRREGERIGDFRRRVLDRVTLTPRPWTEAWVRQLPGVASLDIPQPGQVVIQYDEAMGDRSMGEFEEWIGESSPVGMMVTVEASP